MNDFDFTLLELEDIQSGNKLDMFKKYGTRAAITDFAILLGGYVSIKEYTNEGKDLKYRTGVYYLRTSDRENGVYDVGSDGILYSTYVYVRSVSVRVVSKYSSILSISLNKLRKNQKNIIEFGEYPQTIVSESLSNELERLYNENKLQQTGKEYTTDSVHYYNFEVPFKKRTHTEYEYNGEKYIRILGNYNSDGKMLSDGSIVKEGEPYWVKVEPIVWFVDKERNIAVSKKLLFAGVQFNNMRNYKGDFNSTDMHYFLNNYFAKDIVPSKVEVKMKEKMKKYYRYNIRDFNKTYWNSINASRSFLVGLSIPFMAYEEDGILRDVLTGLPIVPEDANYISDDAIVYNYLEVTDASDVYDNILLIVQKLSQVNELYIPILEKEYIKYISELLKSDELEKYSQNIIENKTDEYILSMRNKYN